MGIKEQQSIAWIIKYRPKHIIDVVGEESKIVKRYIDSGEIPHFLFESRTPGTGKCLGKDTPIIMYDGNIKKVQDVEENDLLMGPDSKPRKVGGATKGRGKLYLIKQKYGDDFVCNDAHILSLISSHKHIRYNVNIEDYLSYSRCKQIDLKGHKSKTIHFKEKKLCLDPYFLGLWIGDGTRREARIGNPDIEIIDYLKSFGKKIGYQLKNHNPNGDDKHTCPIWSLTNGRNGGKKNIVLEMLRDIGVINNKHIPDIYLYNSEENRLQLLAGLLDTDGYLDKRGRCYDFVQKNKYLSEQIVYLARSLGFKTTIREVTKGIKSSGFVGQYYKIIISGDVWRIPCKIKRKQDKEHKRQKDHLRYEICVEEKGIGDYYGFTIDGDGLFLLGDFTITHNTTMAKAIISDLGSDYLEINSSMDRSIDVIREKIVHFVQTMSSKTGIKKIVFMDEFDGMGKIQQESMRSLMETYMGNAIFILTCNNVEKVIDPIKNRCVVLSFGNPKKEDIYRYLENICKIESVKYVESGLNKLIDIYYPSIRNMVGELQRFKILDGEINEKSARRNDEKYDIIWNNIKMGKILETRKTIIEEGLDPDQLVKHFFDKTMTDLTLTNKQIIHLSKVLAEINYRMAMGSDKTIQLVCGLFDIYMGLVK